MTKTLAEKKPEGFLKQAHLLKINSWIIRLCSICNRSITYEINLNNNKVYRNTNCDCVNYWSDPEEIGWEEIAGHYNRQRNTEVIEDMNKFWGFK